MIKIKLFGYKITIEKQGEKQQKASRAKVATSLKKISAALEKMEDKQMKYSEYKLQRESGVSVNTIKKYRSEIAQIRAKKKGLFE
jgi:hypothetical protein